jgi:hypothetical protein
MKGVRKIAIPIVLTEATITMGRLQIEHETTYEYSETVTRLPHKLLLRPREGHDLRIDRPT